MISNEIFMSQARNSISILTQNLARGKVPYKSREFNELIGETLVYWAPTGGFSISSLARTRNLGVVKRFSDQIYSIAYRRSVVRKE